MIEDPMYYGWMEDIKLQRDFANGSDSNNGDINNTISVGANQWNHMSPGKEQLLDYF